MLGSANSHGVLAGVLRAFVTGMMMRLIRRLQRHGYIIIQTSCSSDSPPDGFSYARISATEICELCRLEAAAVGLSRHARLHKPKPDLRQ